MSMFQSGSPYSPFFTAGLKAATKSGERSFLSLDATSTTAESSHSRSVPSPKPAPLSTLPELPQRLGRKNTASTYASTGYRKSRRSDALARLEGRSARLASGKRSNFMSLTDDEEEADSSSDESDDAFAYHFAAQRSSVTLVAADDDSILLPSPVNARPTSSTTSSPKSSRGRRARAASTSQWFPLKSFIDLRDREDDSSSVATSPFTAWRSFMEIGSVA